MKKQSAILVTGGAKRIGAALCHYFAAQGWPIAVHYHQSKDEAERLAEELQKKYGIISTAIHADLLKAKSTGALIRKTQTALAMPVGCLINNASIFERDTPEDFTAEGFQEQMQMNCLAPILLAQAFAAQAAAEAIIINLTDGSPGWSLSPSFFTYTLSKQALSEATMLMARQFGPRIRVNAIAPGPILPSKHREDDAFQKIEKAAPLETHATPEDIAKAAEYLMEAKHVTGQTLYVNGGLQVPRIADR